MFEEDSVLSLTVCLQGEPQQHGKAIRANRQAVWGGRRYRSRKTDPFTVNLNNCRIPFKLNIMLYLTTFTRSLH